MHDDGAHGSVYGGNKARKYEGLLAEARRLGKTRLVSVGAIGSHHVLATALFAREAGLAARCFVVPQPDVPSAHGNLQRAHAAGAELVPVRSQLEAAVRMGAALRDPSNLVIPVGGSSPAGTEPYVQAARELPEARILVVALGSGGTAVGLAVGAVLAGLPWRVHAVATSGPVLAVRGLVQALLVRMLARHRALGRLADVERRLTVVTGELGAGYARPTAASVAALAYAREHGLALEPVYTAKAFAHALALDATGAEGLAFWQTASSVAHAPGTPWSDLPDELRGLFR